MIKSMNIINFLKNSIREINPKENIKTLHTNIKNDIFSGITVAIIALPLALAFGEISQLGPIAGVWGAIAGGIVGGLFGGCMVGVSGPTAPKAAQIATFMAFFVIGTTQQPDLVAAFSIIFLSGLILVIISTLKISRFIHYTPYPVIAGFMCGIGVIVILTQINAFIGLEPEKNLHKVFTNFGHSIQNINSEALYVAIPSILILFFWSKLEHKIKIFTKLPPPLAALIIGTSIANFMNLNIPYIGDKMGKAAEAKIFTFYLPDLTRINEFIGPAFALAALAILDSLLSCKVADNMTGLRHSSDRETFGQGMANMAAGLFGGVTTATATMRTVANIKFGGRTPLASIVHGITLLSILLGFSFLVEAIPTACLAAILFKVGIDILDYRIISILKNIPIADLIIFIIVLIITIYADLMIAIVIGIIFAILQSNKEVMLTFRSTFSHQCLPLSKSEYALDNNDINNLPVAILKPKGPLYFGSIEPLIKVYSKISKHEMLIIDMIDITMIDISGTYALEDLIKNIQSKNIKVIVTNFNSNIKEKLIKLNFIKNIGKQNYIENNIIPYIKEYYDLDEINN